MLRVLGPLEVEVEGTPTSSGDLSSPRLRRLLAALTVRPRVVTGIDSLSDAVWGDQLPANVEASLHNLISRLRRQLHDFGLRDLIVTRPPGYLLDLPDEELDATYFETLTDTALDAVEGDPSLAAALFEQALALWRGPAYAEFNDEEFARARVSQLHERRSVANEARIDCYLRLGDNVRAIALAEQSATEVSFRERPHGQLMVGLYRVGRQADALAAYETFRARLADELGLDPSPVLRQLQTQILNADPALDWSPPSVAAVPPPRASVGGSTSGNVPAPGVQRLVGRADDEAALLYALGRSPVVTLTGPGGVGKTSLALAVANRLQADYSGGVWWFELAALSSGGAIAQAMTTTLGLQARHDGDPTHRLVEALGGRAALLVLDNCEHLVAEAAELVAAIKRGCPEVVVLTTSREPLGVKDEHVIPVSPLPLPTIAAQDAATASKSPAVALLVERAKAATPGFELDDTNAAALAEITRRLDGLPLALELAAIRMRAISPEDLASRLTWRFRLLRQGVRTAPGRHQTLEAVVRWSYELLPEADQMVLELISAFSGSFSLESAEELVSRATSQQRAWEAGDIAGVVLSLADRSMVVAMSSTGRQTRWRLLETIRAYGRVRLGERDYADLVPDVHAEIFATLTADAFEDLFGPGQSQATQMIEAEFDDLRAATTWAIDHHLSAAVLLVGGLLPYCEQRMPVEPLGWAERVIERAASLAVVPPHLERVYAVAASCARFVGELDYAEQLVERGLELVADDDLALAQFGYLRAEIVLFRGRIEEGSHYLAQFTEQARATGRASLILLAELMEVLQTAYLGDAEIAADQAAGLAARAAALGPDDIVAAWATYVQGEVLIDLDPDRAGVLLDDALVRAQRVGDRYLTGVTFVSAASLRARHGDAREAARMYVDVIEHWFAAGDWTHQWTTLRNIVDLLARLEAHDTATVLLAALDSRTTSTVGFGAELRRTEAVRDIVAAQLHPDVRLELGRQGTSMTDAEVVRFTVMRLSELADQSTSR